ncbi:hypothetical protein SH501x_002127 [Pirellulaceae bacterium SH501]
MAVVETLDIVLGAKTQQADSALRDSINETRAVKREFDSLSSSMSSFEPITVAVTAGITDMLGAIPGVSAGIQVFQATAQALNAVFAARHAAGAARIEKALEGVKSKSKDAVQEIKVMRTELEKAADAADDIIDVDFTVINTGAPKIGAGRGLIPRPTSQNNSLKPFEVGQGRSPEAQKAYERSIDEALVKTATYRSTWTAAGGASRAATALGAAGAAAVAAGVGIAVAGIAGMAIAWSNVSAQMAVVDEIADSASKLGMSFRDLSTMRLSLAETSGMDPASIDNAIQKMTVGLSDAASKQSGELFDKLSAAGLNAGELLKMGPAKAMEEIMAKTQDLQNPTDQLVLAYELFGKQGAALVSSLRDGPDALRDMADWADRTGVNLSNAQAEQVGAANDAWGRLEMIATGAWRQIAAESSPVLQVIYEQIGQGVISFSGYLDYLPSIIDNTAYFAGVLYDVYELVTVVQSTMHNIVTLNWSEVGKDIESAFTFNTGRKNIEAIQKARDEAAESAAKKEKNLTNSESQFAAYEEQKQKAKEAEAAEAELTKEQKRQADERQRAAQQSEAAVKKRFDAYRQEIEIQKILGSMSAKQAEEREQEIRERVALHSELREHGMFNFSRIDALADQANALKKQNEERQRLESKASDLNKQFNPASQLRETMRELIGMRQQGLISSDTFRKAALDAAKKDMPDYKGAVSAQAGSVEAYKILLDRENSSKSEQIALKRAAEASLDVQREMLTSIQSIGTVGRAR